MQLCLCVNGVRYERDPGMFVLLFLRMAQYTCGTDFRLPDEGMLLQLIYSGIGCAEEWRWAGLTYGWYPGLGCMRRVDGELPLHTIRTSEDIGDVV
jgi:hypothetical protein